MKNNNRALNWFRKIAIAEGLSFLILLLIAMPLKYFADFPHAVKFVGWAHGVLFIAFIALSFETKSILNKNFFWLVKAFLASILPFGTFVLERQMQKAGEFK
jgi:integral membrane protein